VRLTVPECDDLLGTTEFFENRRICGSSTCRPRCLFVLFVYKTNEFSALQGAERSFASAKIEARK
jgi:hypothetical protein